MKNVPHPTPWAWGLIVSGVNSGFSPMYSVLCVLFRRRIARHVGHFQLRSVRSLSCRFWKHEIMESAAAVQQRRQAQEPLSLKEDTRWKNVASARLAVLENASSLLSAVVLVRQFLGILGQMYQHETDLFLQLMITWCVDGNAGQTEKQHNNDEKLYPGPGASMVSRGTVVLGKGRKLNRFRM